MVAATEDQIKVTSWLILGGNGQLGRSFDEVLTASGIDHVNLGSADCDITDAGAIKLALDTHRPGVIVNCAAWTAVDAAETNEEAAHKINCFGAESVARASHATGAVLVHVSTDYVFRGIKMDPYDEDDATDPVSAYGRSKLCGEEAVRREHPNGSYVVRTAWLYGPHGGNFAKTMLRRALAGTAVRVVNDQQGQPTLSTDLAQHVLDLVVSDAPYGTYHSTNSGSTTWFGFAQMIYRLVGSDTNLVTPVPSTEYPTTATRPANSVLGHARTLAARVAEMRPWDVALVAGFADIIEAVRNESVS